MKENYSKQTLITAIAISLLLGFVGGGMYSSFKLADNTTASMHTENDGHDHGKVPQDHSARFAASIAKFEQHLKENPDDGETWTQLGNLYYDTKQPVKAIEAYERSLELLPGRPGVLTDLGYMYLVSGKPEKSVKQFDKALAVDPGFQPALLNKGVVMIQALEDIEGGIKAWEELVRINPMAKTPKGDTVRSLIERLKP